MRFLKTLAWLVGGVKSKLIKNILGLCTMRGGRECIVYHEDADFRRESNLMTSRQVDKKE